MIPASDGRIYLLRGEASGDFAVSDAPAVRSLLRALDGSRTADEVACIVAERHEATNTSEALDAIQQLAELGLVEDAGGEEALPKPARARYERQLRYFSELVGPGQSRVEPQIRLGEAHVVLLGTGGLGSWAAFALACSGVGRIDVIDGDRVETSNLNRQILFAQSDVGELKAVVAQRTLERFNPLIDVRAVPERLEDADAVAAVIDGADLVVDAADWPAHQLERWVNTACFAQRVPFITMSQLPPLARLGPLYVPGLTGCYECVEAEHRARHPLYDELAAGKGLVSSPAATFGPGCGVIGSQIAMDAVHFLTGLVEPGTLGCALFMDMRTMNFTREPVPKRQDCPVCRDASVTRRKDLALS